MAEWVIGCVADAVVVTYHNANDGDAWMLRVALPLSPLGEIVAWIMTRQNPRPGDRIVLPCGGRLIAIAPPTRTRRG